MGLMPHPEHAVDPLTGSADGGRLFESLAMVPGVTAWPSLLTGSWASPTRSTTASASASGREPNALELAVFSLMWSEHCAYKHSKKLLRMLPTEGPHMLMGPGENAGVVDVGDGLAAAFKVESHNHPSAVEPFQGAATGVGGILRDIFAVGARPIAVLDSLRFGELDSPRSRYLFDWRREGHRPLRQLDRRADGRRRGLLRARLRAELPGERDVRGARAARAADPERGGRRGQPARAARRAHRPRRHRRRVRAGERRAVGRGRRSKRPTVQIGDPFEESKLVECCLELLDRELLASLQDLGAAGLSSSSSEMASKGEVGLDIDVSRVPLREADMEPFEIMISESQERMLCVVEPARLDDVLALCERWDVRATVIGEVTDTRAAARVRRRRAGGRHAGRARSWTTCRCTTSSPRSRPSRSTRTRRRGSIRTRRRAETLLALLASPEHRLEAVRLRAVRLDRRLAHGAAARSRPTPRCSCSSRTAAAARSRCRSTATAGAWRATRTPARSRPCSSARATSPAWAPSRSGSPTASTSATRRSRTSRGSSRARWRASATPASRSACRWWAATCRSTTRAARARSTRRPIIGMVGKLPEPSDRAAHRLRGGGPRDRARGDVRAGARRLGAGEAARPPGELAAAARPRGARRRARAACAPRCASGELPTAHDVSEGGLACALAECCIAGGIGARVRLDERRGRRSSARARRG